MNSGVYISTAVITTVQPDEHKVSVFPRCPITQDYSEIKVRETHIRLFAAIFLFVGGRAHRTSGPGTRESSLSSTPHAWPRGQSHGSEPGSRGSRPCWGFCCSFICPWWFHLSGPCRPVGLQVWASHPPIGRRLPHSEVIDILIRFDASALTS